MSKWKARKLGDQLEGFLLGVDDHPEYPGTLVFTLETRDEEKERTFASKHKLLVDNIGNLTIDAMTKIKAVQKSGKGFVYAIFQKQVHKAEGQIDFNCWRQKAGYRQSWQRIDFTRLDLCRSGCPYGTYYTWESCKHTQPPKTWEGVVERTCSFSGVPIAMVLQGDGTELGFPIGNKELHHYPWTANIGQRVRVTYLGATKDYTRRKKYEVEFLGGAWEEKALVDWHRKARADDPDGIYASNNESHILGDSFPIDGKEILGYGSIEESSEASSPKHGPERAKAVIRYSRDQICSKEDYERYKARFQEGLASGRFTGRSFDSWYEIVCLGNGELPYRPQPETTTTA